MKQQVIIAGGRDFTNEPALESYIISLIENGDIDDDFELICGEARGADTVGKNICIRAEIKVHSFLAHWNTEGKSAGYNRNKRMGKVGDVLIACWDGQSRGTKHMIDIMERMGKPVFILRYQQSYPTKQPPNYVFNRNK